MGYMSGKLLLKLDAIHYILQNHANDDFSFLKEPCNSSNRSTYYFILARLLFMEDNSIKFKAFVAPLQRVSFSVYESTSLQLSQVMSVLMIPASLETPFVVPIQRPPTQNSCAAVGCRCTTCDSSISLKESRIRPAPTNSIS